MLSHSACPMGQNTHNPIPAFLTWSYLRTLDESIATEDWQRTDPFACCAGTHVGRWLLRYTHRQYHIYTNQPLGNIDNNQKGRLLLFKKNGWSWTSPFRLLASAPGGPKTPGDSAQLTAWNCQAGVPDFSESIVKARGTRILVGLGDYYRHNFLFDWIEYKLG